MIIISRGSIYLWKSYEFEDGTCKDKYWISLTCTVNGVPVYAVLPTSQYDKHYKYNEQRCYDTVILEANESQFFPKKTVIDLKNIRKEDPILLKKAIKENRLSYIGQLEQEILERIKIEIENAYTLPQELIDDLTC